MKLYLNGCSCIEAPLDMHGNQIKSGDLLSWDFGDLSKSNMEIEDWMKKPVFKVMCHKSGNGLCAQGINKPLYLHDFRFKYCELIVRGLSEDI
jgi:hypothetical protein